MKSEALIAGLIALAALLPAPAAAEKLGEHPAIVAARVRAAQGYDYASKFYPHPAWLYVVPRAPEADEPPIPSSTLSLRRLEAELERQRQKEPT